MFKGKKFALMVLPLCLSAFGLVSCKNDRELVTDRGTIRDEIVDIELRTTAGTDTIKVLQNLAEKFRDEKGGNEPNIYVSVNKYSGNYSSLATDIKNGFSAGTHPDMAMVYPDAVADFIDAGFCYNLDSKKYMQNETYGWDEEDKSDLIESFLDQGTQYKLPGTYSLPMSVSTEVLYYHNSVLNLVIPNVTTENPDDTITLNEQYLNNLNWEDFFNVLCPSIVAYTETPAGKSLITKENGTAGSGEWAVLGYDSDDNFYITLSEQYGIPYTEVDTTTGEGKFLFDNDAAHKKMFEINEYAKKNYVLTAGSTGNRANDYFKTGQVLFSIGSTAGSKYQYNQGDDIYVTKIPQAKGKDQKMILQGPSMAFLSHKKDGVPNENRKLASWLFYRYLAEKDNALLWSLSADYMPIRKSAYQTDDYKEHYSYDQYVKGDYGMLTARIANYAGTLTDYFFTTPAFKGTTTAREQVGAVLTKAVKKDSTQNDILEQFKKALEESEKAK